MSGETVRDPARSQQHKAARHKRTARRHERGSHGERSTAEALEALTAQGWVVRHDLAWPARPREVIDHVVIGPGGVFVIDSENWSGEVVVRDEVLRQDGYSRESAVQAAAEAAGAVSGAIGGVSVTGVLCFTGSRPLEEWVGDVLVCSTDGIVELLAARPQVLRPEAVDGLARRAMITLPPSTDPRARRARAARAAGGSSSSWSTVRRWARHRFRSTKARAVVALALIGALGFSAPHLAPGLGDLFDGGSGTDVVKVGDTVDVAGKGKRPDLAVTVVSTKDVAKPDRTLADGDHVVAIRMRFKNSGESAWNARSAPRVSIEAQNGRNFDADRWRSTAGGATFSGKPRLKPGASVAVRAMVVLPRAVKAESVSVTLDGSSGTIRWGM